MAPGEAHLVAFLVPATAVVALAYRTKSWELALGGLVGCISGAISAPAVVAEFDPDVALAQRFLAFTLDDLAWTVPSSIVGLLIGTSVMALRRRGKGGSLRGGEAAE